jgi:hypothetical protein
MARSLTRREDWPRDSVGVRRPGGDPLPQSLSRQPPRRPKQAEGQAISYSMQRFNAPCA